MFCNTTYCIKQWSVGVAMLFVKTMVCGVATNSLEITLILQPALMTSKSVRPVHTEIGYLLKYLCTKVKTFGHFQLLKRSAFSIFREPEPQILSYLTQQHKLFPLLATAYAFHFTKVAMTETYQTVNAQIVEGKFANAQEVCPCSKHLVRK